MKKQYAVVLLLLVGMAGCGKKKKKVELKKDSKKTEVFTEVDLPVAKNSDMHSFFDDNVNEFALVDDANKVQQVAQKDEFSWVEENQTQGEGQFKVVYFDFDSCTVRADQESNLKNNIELVRAALEKSGHLGDDEKPVVVIDGHACHSAGSHVYNLALSEKRAKVLADRFVAAGIPSECIKIVGRGMEMPAMIDGKIVDGDREHQWLNRRDELRVLYS